MHRKEKRENGDGQIVEEVSAVHDYTKLATSITLIDNSNGQHIFPRFMAVPENITVVLDYIRLMTDVSYLE